MRKQTITKKDGTTEIVTKFNCTIRSISDEAIELKNGKGTTFNRCTVEFIDANGKAVTMGAKIWGGTFQRAIQESDPMEVGDERMCTASTYLDEDGKPRYSLVVSHLPYTELVSFEEAMEMLQLTAPEQTVQAQVSDERTA